MFEEANARLELNLQIAFAAMNGDAVCAQYMLDHIDRTLPHIVEAAKDQNVDSDTMAFRYAQGVHQRHVKLGKL